MAQIIQKQFPIDFQTNRKAVGFGFPLNGNAVFVPTYQTKDQIKANLLNYLLTNNGERVFNPGFGADLRNLVFSNITDENINDIQTRIQSDIARYFPLVVIKSIKFNSIPDQNTISFVLDYYISNYNINDQLNILLQ
jgi:phage baseplate assembly protein W